MGAIIEPLGDAALGADNAVVLERLRQENHHLRNEVAAFRMGLAVAEREKEKALNEMKRRLVEAEQRAALLGHREVEIAQARKALRDHTLLRDRAHALAERIETIEARNAANARRAQTLAGKLNETQDALAAAESALERARRTGRFGQSLVDLGADLKARFSVGRSVVPAK